MQLLSPLPSVPGSFLRGPLLESGLSAGAQLRPPVFGEVRHAGGHFEQDTEQEIWRVVVEPGHRDEAAEIREVVNANSLLPSVGLGIHLSHPPSSVRTGRTTLRTDPTGTGPK